MDEMREIERLREEAIEAVRALSETTIGKAAAREAVDQIKTEAEVATEALSQ